MRAYDIHGLLACYLAMNVHFLYMNIIFVIGYKSSKASPAMAERVYYY